MGGGLIQLAAYGSQDIYLTGNPQITFFKMVYRRHTNFSIEASEQTVKGNKILGNKVSITVERTGDLVSRIYVEWDVAAFFGTGNSNTKIFAPNIGHSLLKNVLLEIGGERVDRHYSHWYTLWNELTDINPYGHKPAVQSGTSKENCKPPIQNPTGTSKNATLYQRMSYNHIGATADNSVFELDPQKAFIPLQFWFCRNPGLALPLLALKYHDIKLNITFPDLKEITDDDTSNFSGDIQNTKVWVDYIYLDTDERRRFAETTHEYLVEQLQTQTITSTTTQLIFNHPIKELIWTKIPSKTVSSTSGPATPTELNIANSYSLKFNGHNRFTPRHRNYFTRAQIWQYHSGYGGTTVPDSIAVYSFALKPEEHQPSGTCNFSRLDNVHLIQTPNSDTLNVYAINYNILRIHSGKSALAYKN